MNDICLNIQIYFKDNISILKKPTQLKSSITIKIDFNLLGAN